MIQRRGEVGNRTHLGVVQFLGDHLHHALGIVGTITGAEELELGLSVVRGLVGNARVLYGQAMAGCAVATGAGGNALVDAGPRFAVVRGLVQPRRVIVELVSRGGDVGGRLVER